MSLNAIIFDVDGTLIDTNAAHVEAWIRALGSFNYRVAPDRIAAEMGKGGDKFIPSILGQEIYQRQGKELARANTEEFKKIAASTRLKVFPGVKELVGELKRRGLKTVLATSSKMEELETTQRSAGIDLTELMDAVVTADDAAESKPAPDLVHAAVKKLDMFPAQCAMLGDTPYDIDACRDAGVVCFGMLCGGVNSEQTLRHVGARAVYTDPADVLRQIDAALSIASPAPVPLTREMSVRLMREALAAAREGMDAGEVSIGCVLARGDGTIIARGYNELNRMADRTAHAEMVTFAKAAGKVPPEARDLILVSTLEPCVMCLGASMEAAVDTILYALKAPADGGTGRVRPPVSPESQMPRIVGDILAEESAGLLKAFLELGRGAPQQRAFVQQLLGSAQKT